MHNSHYLINLNCKLRYRFSLRNSNDFLSCSPHNNDYENTFRFRKYSPFFLVLRITMQSFKLPRLLTERKISTTVGGFFFAAASLINWMSEYVSVPYRIHLNIYQSQAPTFRVCSRKNIWNGCLIYSTVCLVPSTGHSHHNFTSIQTRKINKHDLHFQKKVPTFTVISTPFLLHLKGYFFRF